MHWADAHGIGYLAFAWVVPSPASPCGDPNHLSLFVTDASGIPGQPNGVVVHDHLAALAAAGRPAA
jgi:endoglucanase